MKKLCVFLSVLMLLSALCVSGVYAENSEDNRDNVDISFSDLDKDVFGTTAEQSVTEAEVTTEPQETTDAATEPEETTEAATESVADTSGQINPTTEPESTTEPTEPITDPEQTAGTTEPASSQTARTTESTQPSETENITVVKPPSCEENGVEINNSTKESRPIPALGHKLNIVGKKASTYFAKGYTGDKVCSVCGKTVSKGKSSAKLKLSVPKVKIKAGKKKIKIKYISVRDASGFQIRYKFKGKLKIKTCYTTKSAVKTIKKLKKGTYKVGIRAFIKQNGKKAYSKWTKTKKVKVR